MSEQDKQKIIDEQKQKHGKILVLEAEGNDWADPVFVIARRPPRAEWQRYRSMLFDEAQRSDAIEVLTRACVVYPEPDEFMRIIAEQPALVQSMGNKLTEAAGSDRVLQAKKL